MSVTMLECMYIKSHMHIYLCGYIFTCAYPEKKSYSLFLTSEEESDINNSSHIELTIVTSGSIIGGSTMFI